jgi:hypothetical protein
MTTSTVDTFTETGEYNIFRPFQNNNQPGQSIFEDGTPQQPLTASGQEVLPFAQIVRVDTGVSTDVTTDWGQRNKSNTSLGYVGDGATFATLPPGFGTNSPFDAKRIGTDEIRYNIGDFSYDLRESKHGISADRCKVTITGSYMMGIHHAASHAYSTLYNNTAVETQVTYQYANADGSLTSAAVITATNSNPAGNINNNVTSYPAPFEALPVPGNPIIVGTQPTEQAGLQVTLVQNGSAVPGGAVNQAPNLELRVTLKNNGPFVPGTATATVPAGAPIKLMHVYLLPYSNGTAAAPRTINGTTFNFTDQVYFKGTFTRSWAGGQLHIIDGVGGDTIPTMSMVATTQFAGDRDLIVEPINLSSSFSLQESSVSVVNAGTISLSTQFSTAMAGGVKTDTAKDLQAQFIFIGSPFNLVLIEPQSYDTAFSTSFVGNKKHNITQLLQSECIVSASAGMIYDLVDLYTWNSFNLSTYFVAGYVVADYSQQEEYHWDDLANDSWDNWTYDIWEGQEESWDGWPFDVWGRTFDLPMAANTTQVGGAIRGAVSNFLSQFFVEDNSAFLESGAAAFASAFTITASAKGLISIESDISAQFQTSTTDNIIRGGSANLESALSFSVSVKLTTDITDTESSEFTFAVTPTVLRIGTGAFSSNFTLDSTAGRIFRVTQTFSSALAFVVEVRMVTQADPYFIITVPQEVRTHVLPAESRVYLIYQENRVNTPATESRVLLVDQETRIHYLPIPPLTNIASTPYERAI